jgi:hypothetical protein
MFKRAAFIALSVAFAACASPKIEERQAPPPQVLKTPPPPVVEAAPAPVAPIDAAPAVPPVRVVLISVDGWHPALLTEELMPAVSKLKSLGSWTLQAETPLPAVTVVSHAAMLTGALPKVNGVSKFEPSGDLSDWRPLKVKTVLEALEADGIRTGAFVQKKKLYGLVPKGATTVFTVAGSDLKDWACATITELDSVRFSFIHLAAIDGAGHSHGWLSKQQEAAARKVDHEIATIATCIHEVWETTGTPFVLIVTADHAGHKRTHGTKADSHVPWIAIGYGIKADHELTGPVRLMDTAPTALKILGKDPATLLPDAAGVVVSDIFEP